jgi:hypothetical protein
MHIKRLDSALLHQGLQFTIAFAINDCSYGLPFFLSIINWSLASFAKL